LHPTNLNYIDIIAITTKTINQQLIVEKIIVQAQINKSKFLGGGMGRPKS
jgi:hypothetical protein